MNYPPTYYIVPIGKQVDCASMSVSTIRISFFALPFGLLDTTSNYIDLLSPELEASAFSKVSGKLFWVGHVNLLPPTSCRLTPSRLFPPHFLSYLFVFSSFLGNNYPSIRELLR